jgi:uncharacterized protein YecE (DUF72 family)
LVARKEIITGCCGFPPMGRKAFFEKIRLLEVQQTFYQPQPEWARKWRKEAPDDFIFTTKSWQAITHDAGSPTYRRLREKYPAGFLAKNAGGFRLNAFTKEAWARTLEVADILRAKAILVQTPARFKMEGKNLAAVRKFFEAVPRKKYILAFEPRGEWNDGEMKKLFADIQAIHSVDPFLDRSLTPGLQYWRLHGLPRYNYANPLTREDLLELKKKIDPKKPHWVFFNNETMAQEALDFARMTVGRSEVIP